jgi:hypothetical protein
MRKYFMTAFVLAAMLVFATSGLALEKTSVRANPGDVAGWDAAASCSVFYANTCTGWLWVWSGWSPTDEIGVILDPCCPNGSLIATQTRFWTGSPTGYGFTGTLAIKSVVANCPGATINSFAYLPVGGANAVQNWTAPAGSVALTYTLGTGAGDPLTIPSDHPAVGPTGPQACGFCYPSTRTIHSFYFGNATTSLCPGSTLNDGVCDAELLNWGGLFTGCPVSVEETSWGAVKNLYR